MKSIGAFRCDESNETFKEENIKMNQGKILFDSFLTPKTGTKIPVGIHSNCVVKSIEVTDKFVDLNFEDSDKRHHNKRLWEPKGSYPIEITQADGTKKKETTAEALAREERLNMSHLVKLAHIFLSESEADKLGAVYEKYLAKTATYKDFVETASSLLNSKLTSKKVNLKVIYDSDGVYSEFGRYPDYIEEYTEGQEPTLAYTPYEVSNRITKKSSNSTTIGRELDDVLA